MIKYQVEPMSTCLDEMKPLLYDSWVELEDGEYELDPDYEGYQTLEDLGRIRVFIARDDGKLIGYLVVMISHHMHHQTIKYAMSDLIYFTPEYRHGSPAAMGLIQYAEKNLKSDGVKRLIIAMKVEHKFEKLLRYLSFRPIEQLWEIKL